MKQSKSANEMTNSASCSATAKEAVIEKKNPKADALEAMAARFEGYAEELAKAAQMHREGKPEAEASFSLSDVHAELSFDLDDLDEIAGLGYTVEKNSAILSVIGVASTLSYLSENIDHASIGRMLLAKLSEALTASARTLDEYANRCDLYGGLA